MDAIRASQNLDCIISYMHIFQKNLNNIKEHCNACFFLGCNQPIKYCPFGQFMIATNMSKCFSSYLPVK